MLSAQLEHVLASSNYAAMVYQRDIQALQQAKKPSSDLATAEIFQAEQWHKSLSTAQIQAVLQEFLANITDETEWMQRIRQLRAGLMFRWIFQDANQLTDVVQLTRELSDFADAAIIAAKQFAYAPLQAKYGQPRNAQGELQDLIVIAMGKLGAQELNLSSDIDLIFAFDENGETDGRKCIEVQQFCILWGQKLIYLLEHMRKDGFVFRVDMRLRPWGDGSALATSHIALEKYLSQHGREWERYAWIKARAITGGTHAEQLMQMTRPFVFRRYVDYSAFAAMRDMKAMIEREVQRRQIEQDIKLGAGGIREIEFIVQVFQLIYGGARRALQERQCLRNLQQLALDGFLAATVAQQLSDAYLFLRRVEHGIQAYNDQQTQALPQDLAAQQGLLNYLGIATWPVFLQQLETHRTVVKQQFKQLIQEQPLTQSEPLTLLQQQLQPYIDAQTQQRLHDFWHSQAVQKLPANALQRLQQFWPYFIRAIIAADAAQTALLRLMPLIESVLRRSVYLVMLTENQGALQRLVKMAQVSPWICEQLTRYPVLLDEFLSMDFSLPRREDLSDTLRQQLLRIESDQVEEQMRALRLFKHSHVLAVAASDVLADSLLMKVSDALTDVAEVTVQAALQLAYRGLVQRHGQPQLMSGTRASEQSIGFVVVGYGKLGGIELGYGSDLDLVFIHHYDEQVDTDGAKAITGVEFAIRLAQKLMSLLTTQTLDGRAYEVDTRLRPSGEAGVLVPSLNAFEQYQHKSAWLWEHQALVRARPIAGDSDLAELFQQIRKTILTQSRDAETVRLEVLNMRNKMKAHLGSSASQKKHGIFHLKQDAGGIVDIEFMAQYAVLAWSGSNPDLAHFSDNVRILEDAAKLGCLPSADATALIHAYLSERAESHRLALANQSMQVNAADWHTTREIVYRLWQRLIDPSALALGAE